MTITEKLNQIFRHVFDDDSIEIEPSMTTGDIEGWDSLSHVNLIMAIETGFNIRFSQKELLTFRQVGDLLEGIAGKTAA